MQVDTRPGRRILRRRPGDVHGPLRDGLGKDGPATTSRPSTGSSPARSSSTVPDTLAPGTYDTSASAPGDAGFFFHGHLGYAGYGTGSFTVLRSTYDDAGQVVSFLATYDEVLDDSLGASHVVGVVSWADTGDVPQVVQITASVVLAPSGQARLQGVLLSTDGNPKTVAAQRISHGTTIDLQPVASAPTGDSSSSIDPPARAEPSTS